MTLEELTRALALTPRRIVGMVREEAALELRCAADYVHLSHNEAREHIDRATGLLFAAEQIEAEMTSGAASAPMVGDAIASRRADP